MVFQLLFSGLRKNRGSSVGYSLAILRVSSSVRNFHVCREFTSGCYRPRHDPDGSSHMLLIVLFEGDVFKAPRDGTSVRVDLERLIDITFLID